MKPHVLLSLATILLMIITGCGSTVAGQGVSPLYDPFKVGGMPAVTGPSGIRDNAPPTTGTVLNTDDGPVDHLALLAVNDIAEYWSQNYSPALPGEFIPVKRLVSYDSTDRSSPRICGGRTYEMVNAFYCPPMHLMAWDRGVMVPVGQKFFGDMSIAALMAHEYGHAVQRMADMMDRRTPSVVVELQADCLAGDYLRWVADGSSPRFTLDTGDGLNHVLAGVITIRDPLLTDDLESLLAQQEHGTALDRVGAFQMGFTSGTSACKALDEAEVQKRRGDLPIMLDTDDGGQVQTGEVPLDEDVLGMLMDDLGTIYSPSQAPTLSFDPGECENPQPGSPVAYCADSNTIAVDLPALQKFSAPADERRDLVLLQGDNTGISALTSRYALAVQKQRGLAVDTPASALRTACLTGVAQRAMIDPSAERKLKLTAGDIDEAVSGLLVNGIVASNVDGATVPAGFTRIVAYRSGLEGDADLCYQRFA